MIRVFLLTSVLAGLVYGVQPNDGSGEIHCNDIKLPTQLPVVDISSEKYRHVVIARGTEDEYQGHADTVLMPDGKTMFCVWTLNHGWGTPFMKQSNNAGKTWKRVSVPAGWNDWKGNQGWLPMIHYLVGPDGKGRLIIFDRGQHDKLIQSISDDGGQTWSPMKPNGLHGIEASMNIISSPDSKKLMMWNSDWTYGIYQAESYNGGLTWINERSVIDTNGLPGIKMIEPGVVRSPDSKQLLMLIRDFSKGAPYNAIYSVSDDEGKTWSRPKRLPAGLEGERYSPLYTHDGRLIVAMRGRSRYGSAPTDGHFIAWVGRYEDIVEGRDGAYVIKLLHNYAGRDCGYPALETLPDGTIIATTYIKYTDGPKKYAADGKRQYLLEAHSVVSTRFKVGELDRMLNKSKSVLHPILK